MQWQQLLSTQRFEIKDNKIQPTVTRSTEEGKNALRTDFHIDYDRVVFSGSFRRLGRKTQVHPFAKHDLTHNRLTHSVEVASVGRSLGNHIGLILQENNQLPPNITPQDIGTVVQVACLSHDMGNPPFGHTGEAALREWFSLPENQIYLHNLTPDEAADIQTYEGNAHTLRIVTNLEMYQNKGGMRLTAATIGSLLKYPWTANSENGKSRGKFNIYCTELAFMQEIAKELGLPEIAHNSWARHPLSYLMEAADDICYALLDLEDAVEIGMLNANEVERLFAPMAGETVDSWHAASERQRCAMLRGMAIGKAIDSVANTFYIHHKSLLAGDFPSKDLISVTEPMISETLANAKEIAANQVFRHENKVITEIAAYPCLGSILSLLIPTAYNLTTGKPLNHRQELALSLLGEHAIDKNNDTPYLAYMKILDFVGSMTDNTAARMAREVSGISMI
ncbi:MAG: deoxyguanosinetriphosphate triphosphohydrolase [Neisseriaceae bacterium]|nr:deoxyguanosinetriphosphate triphosphohydrolase [Neisseriaceae bacterium]